jgi:hypothetical protein
MAQPRLKFWGYGNEGEGLTPGEIRWLEGAWAKQFHVREFDLTLPPTADDIRLRPQPTYRAATTVRFQDFFRAADAVRVVSQVGLYPANCRLLDPETALRSLM